MSDIHVLTGHDRTWRVLFHFPIPNSNNSAGINYRTALLNSGLGGTSILPDGDGTAGTISATELTNIGNGSVYEYQFDFVVESGGTSNAQLQTTLRGLFAAKQTEVLANLAQQLKYFGHVDSAT